MTIYIKDLAKVVSSDEGVTFNTTEGVSVSDISERIAQALFNKIIDQVNAGNKVFVSDFGGFSFVEKPARKARNPKTGETVDVAAYKKLVFKPVKDFRKVK